MKLVGLSGGISSGKSTVSSIIKREGIPVIDCDKIAHDVMEKGRWGYNRTVKAFGPSILGPDGEIDRAVLGSIVFADRAARQRLNKASHLPIFLEIIRQLLVYWLKFQAFAVVDMPLLFETNSDKWAGINVLVTCDAETQMKRLMHRDSCTREQAEAKVAAQMPLAEKLKLCDLVIDNNGTMEETERQTMRMLCTIRKHGLWHQLLLGPGMACAILAGIGSLAWLII